MLHATQIDALSCLLTSLDREALLEQFRIYPARFPVDFTADYLHSLSVDQLRHLFFALCLQNQRMPDIPSRAA